MFLEGDRGASFPSIWSLVSRSTIISFALSIARCWTDSRFNGSEAMLRCQLMACVSDSCNERLASASRGATTSLRYVLCVFGKSELTKVASTSSSTQLFLGFRSLVFVVQNGQEGYLRSVFSHRCCRPTFQSTRFLLADLGISRQETSLPSGQGTAYAFGLCTSALANPTVLAPYHKRAYAAVLPSPLSLLDRQPSIS